MTDTTTPIVGLRALATCTQRSATARIGSRQRLNFADSAYRWSLILRHSAFAKEAAGAALLAGMAAQAWNENKAANQRRLRAANRNLRSMLTTRMADIIEQRHDLDAECTRTFQAANALRTQAIDAAKYLRYIARMIEYGS